jgi:hypothetical protein
MKRLIGFRPAIRITLVVFGLLMLFHLVVVIGIAFFDYVPIDFLWGGRMETKEQLLVFEFVSVLISALCFIIVLIRAGSLKVPAMMTFSRVALWILFVLFALNTVGNLFAKTAFEKSLSAVTLILALLCLRLALEPLSHK